jgi:hypothetical protein
VEGYLGEFPLEIIDTTDPAKAIEYALLYNGNYGGIDGEHHKMWVLDQMSRVLLGTPVIVTVARWQNGQEEKRYVTGAPSAKYVEWVKKLRAGKDGPETYGYDEGIAP